MAKITLMQHKMIDAVVDQKANHALAEMCIGVLRKEAKIADMKEAERKARAKRLFESTLTTDMEYQDV